MKICILGPVTSENHFGGVATFNEGLEQGFLENGHEVLVLTNIKNDKKNNNIRYYSKASFFLNPTKIVKDVKVFKPDLVISSMWYGVLNKFIKKSLPKTKTIHFLHGFPTYRYNKVKRKILLKAFKNFRKHSDLFVSNSAFTSCINTEIYGLKSDKTVHIGLQEQFIDFKKTQSEKVNFLFVGRLVKEKNVDRACEIFNYIRRGRENFRLTIIGDGPEKEYLQKKYQDKHIHFTGKKTREEALNELSKANIFISLNPHEPFGLVYLEALLKKCKIICPNTGGHNEFLRDFKEVLSIDINNFENYTKEFEDLMNLEAFALHSLESYFEYFSYKRVAKELGDI